MDASSPYLRKTLHGRFDLLASNQHQIGHLVDHHYKSGSANQYLLPGTGGPLLIKSGLYAPSEPR